MKKGWGDRERETEETRGTWCWGGSQEIQTWDLRLGKKLCCVAWLYINMIRLEAYELKASEVFKEMYIAPKTHDQKIVLQPLCIH